MSAINNNSLILKLKLCHIFLVGTKEVRYRHQMAAQFFVQYGNN